MDIKVLDDNPLYKDQTYRLKFTFSAKYPIGKGSPESHFWEDRSPNSNWLMFLVEPPEVQFITLPPSSETPRAIPMHPHIYSNGIICLDLLGQSGWSPVQTVESVCMSLQSMLTANTKDERPPGDHEFVMHNRRRIRDINFVYEDDNVWWNGFSFHFRVWFSEDHLILEELSVFCKGFFHLVNNGNEDTQLLSFTGPLFSFFLHFWWRLSHAC